MKKYLYRTLIVLCFALVGFSCEKEESDEEVMLDDVTLNFAPAKKSVQVDLPLDRVSNYWHIYAPSEDSWLQYEVIPGRKSMYVVVDGNLTDDVRSSYIMVRSGRQTQRIQVAQDTEGGISLSSDYLPVRYLGASSSLTILNTEFLTDLSVSVEDTETEWCSALIDGDRLFVNTRFNDRTEARSALLTVTGKRAITGETRTAFVTVYQGKGGMTPYVFEIPDFSESQVYKVMDGQKQVAQITREFLRAKGKINAQAVVVYPVENDEVDLSMGYVAQIVLENSNLVNDKGTALEYTAPTGAVHGGTVSFDMTVAAANLNLDPDSGESANLYTNPLTGYIAGTLAEPVTKIYMPGDVGMGPEEVVGSKEATVVPHVITDERNDETNVYPIVKIGTQYWMGKHLNTVYYNKNKNFEAIPTNFTGTGEARRPANFCVFGNNNGKADDEISLANRAKYGLLYSYLTIGGFASVDEAGLTTELQEIPDNISPEGWIVPSFAEIKCLQWYIVRMQTLRHFGEVGIDADDNISGFDGPNSSYRHNSGFQPQGAANGCFMHSRTFRDKDNAAAFHTTDAQTRQSLNRAFAIRSLNDGGIRIKAQ